MIRIMLTGGGSGGHLFPLVAVSRKILELAKEQNLGSAEIYYLGPGLFLENSLKKEPSVRCFVLVSGKWRRYFSFKNFIDLFKIIIGFIQALWKVWIIMPNAVFSKGGYGSVAVVIACWLYHVPIIIHDSDSVPGAANKLLSPLADAIAVSFNEAADYFPKNKTYFSGEAVREDFFNQPDPARERALLKLISQKPAVFISGGSQGAKKINDAVLNILPDLLKIAEVIHQTGSQNYDEIIGESKIILKNLPLEISSLYHPADFLSEPEYIAAMHSASLIISRTGAGSIFEIAASGKAAILVPITESPRDHNRRNGYIFSEGGRAEIIEETNLGPNLLLSVIDSILNNPSKRKSMEEKSKAFATPDAAKLIAEALFNLIS